MTKRAIRRLMLAAVVLSTAVGAGYVYHRLELDERRSALIRTCSPDKPDVIASCTAWIAVEPANTSPLSTRASAYARAGEFDRALRDYDEALRLDPSSVHNFYMRGRLHADMKRYRLAIADYTAALVFDPTAQTASRLYRSRAEALETLQDLKGAVADYAQAFRLDPAVLAPLERSAHLHLKLESYDEAIAALDQLLKEFPRSAQHFVLRGNAYFGRKLYARAIEDFDRAIAIAPKFTAAYLSRASSSIRLGATARAIADLRVAIRLAPGFQPAVDILRRLERETSNETLVP